MKVKRQIKPVTIFEIINIVYEYNKVLDKSDKTQISIFLNQIML